MAAAWIRALLLLQLVAGGAAAQEPATLRLRELEIGGLPVLSSTELREMTGLREGQRYPVSQLYAARDSLAFRLHDAPGYPFARVDSFAVDTLAGSRAFTLNIGLDPGPAVVVGRIAFDGPLAGQEELLRARLRTSPGDLFRGDLWREDLIRAITLYREQGYPFARVTAEQVAPSFGTDSVVVNMTLTVQPGARATIQRVEFAGLEHTKPATARRVARLKQQLYHPETLERAQRRLLRTGWFAEVSPGEVFQDREGRYGVLFQVREQPTSSVSGVLGYAARDEGVAGAFDATLANLFGDGRAVDLHWRRDGPDSRAFSVAYLEPFLFGWPLDARIHLSQEVRDSQYVAVEFGGELSARLADEWTVTGSVRRRMVTADSLAFSADTLDYSLTGLGASLAYDTRDRRGNPRIGAYARLGSERLFVTGAARTPASGGAAYSDLYRHSFELQAARPVNGDWVGFTTLHGVEVRADNAGRVPVAEWEQLGGAASVRGFAERSLLSPRAGWGTLELRYLLGPFSRVYTLLDGVVLDIPAASAGGLSSSLGGTRWEWSYGAGVQVDTGAGLLNVAVAVPGGEGLSAAVVHVQAVARF